MSQNVQCVYDATIKLFLDKIPIDLNTFGPIMLKWFACNIDDRFVFAV